MGFTLSDLKERLTNPYNTDEVVEGDTFGDSFAFDFGTKGRIHLMLKTYQEGYWQRIIDNITILEREVVRDTKTGDVLDNYAEYLGLKRNAGEEDNHFRLRIKAEENIRFGGPHPDRILEFVEQLIDGEPGDVTITENEDIDGNYQHAFFRLQVDGDRLEALGFDDLTSIASDIESLADRAAAAGVRVKVNTLTGGDYDSATYDEDTYDP